MTLAKAERDLGNNLILLRCIQGITKVSEKVYTLVIIPVFLITYCFLCIQIHVLDTVCVLLSNIESTICIGFCFILTVIQI